MGRRRSEAHEGATRVLSAGKRELHQRAGRYKRQPSQRGAAGKTGTSQDSRDAWFIGYTPDLVAGIWFGNDDNSPMAQVGGGSFPAQTWLNFMKPALDGVEPRSLLGVAPLSN